MRVDSMFNGIQTNTQAMNGLSLNELTLRLSPGDIIRAQILEFVANEVLLKLFDSTTIQATVPEGFEGEVGKFENFIVKESLPDKLVLEEQKNTAPKLQKDNGEIIKALSKLNIPQTEDNIKLAKTIIDNKLPLTKDFFDNTSKLLQSSMELDIPKAIIMEANKIEATPLSIKQLGLLEKGSVSLGNQLNELATLLENAISDSVNKNDLNTAKGQDSRMTDSMKNSAKQTVPEKGGALQENIVPTGNAVDQKKFSEVTPKFGNEIKSTEEPASKAADGKVFDAKAFLKQVEDTLKPKDDLIDKDSINKKEKLIDTKTDKPALNKEALQENIKKAANELKNTVERIFVRPEDLDKEQKVELEKNIKTMGEKLEDIKKEVSSLDINNKEAILQKVDNILNQMRFINDIKSFGYYIPIPVKLNGVLEQADLYVLKRNKNKKVNPEDATIFLALDTTNMGRIETLLCVNKKSISMNMRIEEKKYEDYIKTRFVDLYNLLSSKGYKLTDIKYRQISEPINMFNVNMIANDLLASNNNGVDIRL